jgi:polar amino acid transport system substrate-binding protein
VTRTAGVDKAFEAVISGEADYVIVGLYPGITAAAQFGVTGKLEPLDPPLVTAEMFIAFSKKSPCLGLMDAFSTAIAAKSTDGSFAAMLGEATTAWQNWVARN